MARKTLTVGEWGQVQRQINQYFRAVHGPDYIYRAPETFENLLEQWMIMLAGGNIEEAGKLMTQIEKMASENR